MTHEVYKTKILNTCIYVREILEMKRQNMFLFYEKNEDDQKIDEKLVRLYMNRFIIEEDHQNELVGIADLTKLEEMNFQIEPRFRNLPEELQQMLFSDIYYRWKMLKERKLVQDMYIINTGMVYCKIFQALWNSKTFDQPVSDIHFIIGSSYYMNIFKEDWFREKTPTFHSDLSTCKFHEDYIHPMEELIVKIMNQFRFYKFKNSFACTFVCGHTFAICKKSEVQDAYQSHNKSNNGANQFRLASISSVNNDLEEFYDRMMITNIFMKVIDNFVNAKFSNEYKESFLFRTKSHIEKLTYLDQLFYDHSFSVGANPEIIHDPTSFQLYSKKLDISDINQSKEAHFFPPMREPPRKNLKLSSKHI